MLLRGTAIYAYIVMNGVNAPEMVCYLVHAHLKDTLGHLQAKWHVQEPVPAMVIVECGQVGGPLIEVYAPEAVLCISLLKQAVPLNQ